MFESSSGSFDTKNQFQKYLYAQKTLLGQQVSLVKCFSKFRFYRFFSKSSLNHHPFGPQKLSPSPQIISYGISKGILQHLPGI